MKFKVNYVGKTSIIFEVSNKNMMYIALVHSIKMDTDVIGVSVYDKPTNNWIPV